MKILFAFENPLPSREADAEVFGNTARHLAAHTEQAWFHVPVVDADNCAQLSEALGMPVLPARAPLQPAALRHLRCGVSLVQQEEFRQTDLVYTRNLWIARMALRHGQRVVFDHYRPWPEQIPPLQRWIHQLMAEPGFLLHICHSEYTRDVYRRLGVPAAKLCCIRNGYDPGRLRERLTPDEAKRQVGFDARATAVVYTGRINQKKGLDLVLQAAAELPDVAFVLVGSRGPGPIEALAAHLSNVRIVEWQSPEALAPYLFAADILLIPPSSKPLSRFGSTVLPLKIYLYLAAGRPILAGDTADVAEVLAHDRNAWLCAPDSPRSLIDGIRRLRAEPRRAARLAAAALRDGVGYTWQARSDRIAGAVAERVQAAPPVAPLWDQHRTRTWSRDSRRWLTHLLRTRSLVLPPAAARND